jgi:hypothetical protein
VGEKVRAECSVDPMAVEGVSRGFSEHLQTS